MAVYVDDYGQKDRKRRKGQGKKMEGYEVRDHIRAYNHKIHPIMLTVISTVLGLVPFLFDGPDEVFCFRRKPSHKSR